MASIRFPSAPSLNQNFTASGRTWKWAGSKWLTVPASVQYATSTKVDTLESTLAADLAAKASAADLAAKASLAGAETLSNKTLTASVLNSGIKEKVAVINGNLSMYSGVWNDQAGIWYFTTAAQSSLPMDIGNASSSLLASMAIGQSVSQVVLITQGATGYLPTSFTVDSTAATVKWLGGSAPKASTNAIDALTFTIIKTGASAFTLLGSAAKYA